MQRVVALVLFLIFISISAIGAEEIIKKGETLSLQRCIEISLMRQPNILAAASTVDASRSRVGESKANYYPQINWTSGYSRISPVSGTTGGSSSGRSSGTTTNRSFDQYTSSAALNQNIYDFGRTSAQVKIANLNYDSSRFDFRNVSEQIIQNVEQAYYGVLAAKRNRDVAADSVRQFQLHLEQAKGFYEVGTKPKFDVTKAEVDLSNAKLNLIKAENALKIAIVNLNNAMGVPEAPDYTIEDNLSFSKYEITLEEALSRAYENRPDLQSIVAKRKAAEASVDFAKANYYPSLTGNASYSWAGETFPLDHGWTAGATLSIPIFSGFLTKNQVAESRANVNVLKAGEESVRQTVILDVQQAFLNLKEAEERVPAAELGVQQAQENLDIANGRYAAGVGSPIEVTDAEVSLATAKTSYIQALYDCKTARSSLEKAMGAK